jgi:hypothetical protein
MERRGDLTMLFLAEMFPDDLEQAAADGLRRIILLDPFVPAAGDAGP